MADTDLPHNPQVPSFSDPLQWVTAYLVAHMLSNNSRRYMYLLWFCIAFVFVVCSVVHWTGAKGGILWAYWERWAIRRRTWRGQHYINLSRKQGRTVYPTSLPPNGQLLCIGLVPVVACILAFVGPDYISPSIHLFDLTPAPLSTRSYDTSMYVQYQPNYTIGKSWWTSGGRAGLMAFALFPLCILFVLKSPPFAIFAIPFATQIHFDKLSWLHRWSARLIWLLTALHVVLWSVQLFKDRLNNDGSVAYKYAFLYQKFIFGWIAFALMTLLNLLSIRPLRRHHYESFWIFHVLLVPLMLVFSALHHPPVWHWCWAALAIWVGERTWRFTWWLHTNGFFGSERRSQTMKPFPASPNTPNSATPFGAKGGLSPGARSPDSDGSYPPPSPYLSTPFSRSSMIQPSTAYKYIAPSGYAHAELLSGATVRLTFIPPGFLSWAPGQHFLINIPSVSRFLTHPFTSASICDEQSNADSARAVVFLIRSKGGWTRDLWDHVVKLTNAGQKFADGEDPGSGAALPRQGVILKTFVEGPFGSSVGAHWERHSTVVIFVGGSGVSFGMSILEYMCLLLAGRDGRYLGGKSGGWGRKGFAPRRVRFVWLIREYSHIQWCAGTIKRCVDMIPSPGLDIDIFVTNFKPKMSKQPEGQSRRDSKLAIPGHLQRSSSNASTSSEVSVGEADDYVDLSYYTGSFGDEDESSVPEGQRQNYTRDLTDFDGDNDATLPGEDILNRRVRKVGQARRIQSMAFRESQTFNFRVSQFVPPPYRQSGVRESGLRTVYKPSGLREGSKLKRESVMSTESTDHLMNPGQNARMSMASLTEEGSEESGTTSPTLENSKRFSASSAHFVRPSSPLSNFNPLTYDDDPNSSSATLVPARPTLQTSFAPGELPPPRRPHAPSGGVRDSIQMSDFVIGGAAPTVEVPEPTNIQAFMNDSELMNMSEVAEHARPGKPKMDRILQDEVERSRGSVVVACCGPASFNAMVRKAIAQQIDPERIRKGDRRGYIDYVSEEFEF